jgi:hypothetical protein
VRPHADSFSFITKILGDVPVPLRPFAKRSLFMRHQTCFWIASVLSGALTVAVVAQASTAADWKAPARWHRSLKKAVPGTLVIDGDGVEFGSGAV